MATNSVNKSIVIKSLSAVSRLTNALENAKGKKPNSIVLSKKTADIKQDKILDFFGDNK